jgi:hypothetical protein
MIRILVAPFRLVGKRDFHDVFSHALSQSESQPVLPPLIASIYFATFPSHFRRTSSLSFAVAGMFVLTPQCFAGFY